MVYNSLVMVLLPPLQLHAETPAKEASAHKEEQQTEPA